MKLFRQYKKRCGTLAHAQIGTRPSHIYYRFLSTGEGNPEAALSAASEAVEALQKEDISISQRGKMRKFSKRHHYDDETRTAMEKFTDCLGFDLSEATL